MTTELARFEPAEAIRLNDFPPDRFNVLIPGDMTMQMSPFLRPVARQVKLSKRPIDGDVYPITQRKQGDDWVPTEVGISAVGLAKIGSVAGTLDVPQASGRVDNGSDPKVVTYRATMAYRLPDGEPRLLVRECTLNLDAIEDEIRAQKQAKADKSKGTNYEWSAAKLEAEVQKELVLKRRFKERLAETGAKNRCYRAIFAIKSKYAPDELDKPFVIAAVIPDVNQPELRERLLDRATSATAAVFGPGEQRQEPRLLGSSSPTPEQVAEATGAAEGGEITAEELGAVEAAVEERTVTADGEVVDEPDFGAPAEEKKADERPADWLAISLRERAEAAAGSSKPGSATQAQRTNLKRIFRTVGSEGAQLVLAAAYGLKDLTKVTEAQADAILDAAEVTGFDTDLAGLVAALREGGK